MDFLAEHHYHDFGSIIASTKHLGLPEDAARPACFSNCHG